MKKILRIFIFIILIILGCSMCSCEKSSEGDRNTGYEITMAVLNLNHDKLAILPSYDKYSNQRFQVDLRGYNLTNLRIKDKLYDLLHSDFDTNTKWPYRLPAGFNPKIIMKYGKNPGLGIEKLHEEGINGKGIGIAIIDNALLIKHKEYSENLKSYEEIHCLDKTATVSGCAAVSVAVGKTCGVATEADLYYIAETHGDYVDDKFITDLSFMTSAVNRVVDINEKLKPGRKIRVLCIGANMAESDKGFSELYNAMKNAQKAGIFIVSNFMYEMYSDINAGPLEYDYSGAGRDPMKNPDNIDSYGPGLKWANDFYNFSRITRAKETLLVPCDSRCTASPTGEKDYAFYNMGEESLASSYIGGLYALACQVKPDITPQVFWEAALNTGSELRLKNPNINCTYKLKRIVNPQKLINLLKE